VSDPHRRRSRDGQIGERTTVRRLPEKQVRDRAALDAVLDAALMAHVAVFTDGQPYVVPVGCARDGDRLLVHGSTASRAFRWLAEGRPTCATVTLLDGVVVARSHFESSMHYRSAMLLGAFTELHGEQKRQALATLASHLLPGLDDGRPPSALELRATNILAMPITEWSLKVSDSPPEDAEEDLERPVWAGVVPLWHVWGRPVDAPDLAAGRTAPAALSHWPEGRS
jgi:nitroimidazol reductase NimA-like FMN-containing flavoprotein (pyridoxamine 5'-phosphate oxidase superfamily)